MENNARDQSSLAEGAAWERLMLGARLGNLGQVRSAILDGARPADIEQLARWSRGSESPLSVAAWNGRLDCLVELIKFGDPSLNPVYAKSIDGQPSTALSFAAKKGNLDCAKALFPLHLSAGGSHLSKAMFDVASIGDVEALREAVSSAGADHRIDGKTLLMALAEQGVPEMISIAISISSIDERDKYGATALFYAADARKAQACALLLSAGASATAIDHLGCTPLMSVAAGDSAEEPHVIETLMALLPASDPNQANGAGETALIVAIVDEAVRQVEALLPLSNLEAADNRGRTALDYARESLSPEIVSLVGGFALAQREAQELSSASGMAAPHKAWRL